MPARPQNGAVPVEYTGIYQQEFLRSIGEGLQVRDSVLSPGNIVLEEGSSQPPAEQEPNIQRNPPHTARINAQGLNQPKPTPETVFQDMKPYIMGFTSLADRSTVNITEEEGSETVRQLDALKSAVQRRIKPKTRDKEPHVQVAMKTPLVAGTASTKLYKCREPGCSPTVFDKYPTFKRHVESKHHPNFKYRCPISGCDKEEARRDKIHLHCKCTHLMTPTRLQLAKYKIPLMPPPQCTLCTRVVMSWTEFYKCWLSHCVVDQDSLQHDALPRSGGDEGHGGADAPPGNGSLFSGRGAGTMPPSQGDQSQDGSTQGRGASYNGQSFNQTPMGQYHTNLGQISPEIHRQMPPLGNTQPDPPSRQGQTRDLLGSIWPIPRSQQPPTPRPQQGDGESLHPQQFHCYICEHQFSSCEVCSFFQDSKLGCHRCPPGVMSLSMENRMRLASGATARSNQTALNMMLQGVQQPRNNGAMSQYLSPSGYAVYPGQQQYYPRQGGGGGPQGSYGGSTFNSYGVSMLTRVPDPLLGEDDIYPNNLKTMKGQMFAATCIDLPIGVPLPTASSIRTDPLFLSANGNKVIESPMCGPPPLKEYKSHAGQARIELVPGKVLYVGMKILPDRGSHPLRTRVRVLVKLFKLRSSVARAGSKKKTKEDIKAIEKALCLSFKGLNLGSESVKIAEDKDQILSDIESDADCLFSDADSETSMPSEASISDLRLLARDKHGSSKPCDLSDSGFFDGKYDEDNDDSDFNPSRLDNLSEDSAYESDTESEDEVEGVSPEELFDHWCIEPEPRDEIEGTEFKISIVVELNRLSPWRDGLADIEADDNITDPTLVFEYFVRYILYVMFTLSRSRNHSSYSKFLE
ncbi:hypothetical protein N7540_002327 [Penicillium herquei]|nr:hypothetical protein N7540_002327 [Penicillium herquei]